MKFTIPLTCLALLCLVAACGNEAKNASPAPAQTGPDSVENVDIRPKSNSLLLEEIFEAGFTLETNTNTNPDLEQNEERGLVVSIVRPGREQTVDEEFLTGIRIENHTAKPEVLNVSGEVQISGAVESIGLRRPTGTMTFDGFELVAGVATVESQVGFYLVCKRAGLGGLSITVRAKTSDGEPWSDVTADLVVECTVQPTPTPEPTATTAPDAVDDSVWTNAYLINGLHYDTKLFSSSGPPRPDGCDPGYTIVAETDYQTEVGGEWQKAPNAILSYEDPAGPELEPLAACGFGYVGKEIERDDGPVTRAQFELFCDQFFKRTLPEGIDPSLASSFIQRSCESNLR